MAGAEPEGDTAWAEERWGDTQEPVIWGLPCRPQGRTGAFFLIATNCKGDFGCAFYSALPGCCGLESVFPGARKDADKPVTEVLARDGGCVSAPLFPSPM